VKNEKTKKRPFAIEFLEPLPDGKQLEVNGGRHKKHHGGLGPLTGILTHPTSASGSNDFAQ